VVNGIDTAALTLFDVLDEFEEIPVCVAYRWRGSELTDLPAEPWVLQEAEPVFEVLPGWRSDTTAARRLQDLPPNGRRYVDRLAELLGCEVGLVSVGPERSQTLLCSGSRLAGWLS